MLMLKGFWRYLFTRQPEEGKFEHYAFLFLLFCAIFGPSIFIACALLLSMIRSNV